MMFWSFECPMHGVQREIPISATDCAQWFERPGGFRQASDGYVRKSSSHLFKIARLPSSKDRNTTPIPAFGRE
jgi:hypothetical protein